MDPTIRDEPPEQDGAGGLQGAPAAPDRGWGRRLRTLTGVDEQLLAWVPTERPRYTALGGVVLGTAVIAGFSMWNALTAVLGGAHVLLLLPVLAWALFVLNLDRWLVSSSAGSQWRRRASVLLPRLLVAVFFGFIVAEPLVLRIFQTAVEQHIRDGREEQLNTLQTNLVACNPLPASAAPASQPTPPPADCDGYVIPFGTTPAGVVAELAALRGDATALEKTIAADTKQLDRLNDLARRECAGDSGPGLTGVVGEGPHCLRLRGEADRFSASHPITANNARLAELRSRISALEGQFRTGSDDFERARDTAIGQRVAAMKSHHGPIGLLERFRALDELVSGNPFLFATSWLIRIFFILIDCLPVLVKLFTGSTAYDRLVDERVTSTNRIYSRATRSAEARVTVDLDVQQYEAESAAKKQRERIDLDLRKHTAGIHADLDRAVQTLAEDLRHRSRTRRNPAGRGTDANSPAIDLGHLNAPMDAAGGRQHRRKETADGSDAVGASGRGRDDGADERDGHRRVDQRS